MFLCPHPTRKTGSCAPCGKGLTTRGAQHVLVRHKRSRGQGGCPRVYRRCARQLCLLLCRVALQGNPGTQQLLLQQQEGRSRAGSAGRSLGDRGGGPACLMPGSKGKEICTHLQLSFHTGLLIYFQSTCTSSRQMKHFFTFFPSHLSCIPVSNGTSHSKGPYCSHSSNPPGE